MFPVEEPGVDETEEGGIYICARLWVNDVSWYVLNSQALLKMKNRCVEIGKLEKSVMN